MAKKIQMKKPSEQPKKLITIEITLNEAGAVGLAIRPEQGAGYNAGMVISSIEIAKHLFLEQNFKKGHEG